MSHALDLFRAGRISAEMAVARLALSGEHVAIASEPELARLAARHGLAKLDAMRRAVDHGTAATPAALARMFDAAVAASPEASVAAASLGDPALLARATAEIVEWLRAEGLIRPGARVLDLGCGIGRIAAALAPEVGCVHGLDVSPGMIAEARRRVTNSNVRFAVIDGDALPGLPWSPDLVLAVDCFPYLVQAGVAERFFGGIADALAPGGALAVLNWSYRGLAQDCAEAAEWSARYGLALLRAGAAPFALWDGTAFLVARPSTTSPSPADSIDAANTASFIS